MNLSTLALLAVAVSVVAAFPFSAGSGVVELTPKTMSSFLNTHKPVFIMFYAPWCGHCKAAHPEYEKFAKGVKDVVRVGAVNADQYREIGSQFGIQGFPTIKYWKMGSKKGKSPLDYQGARSHGAFHNAALAEIVPAVTIATSLSDVTKAIDKASAKKAVILASAKNKSPPIFSVLSQSPKLTDKISFVLVSEKSKGLVGTLGIEKVPTVLVVSTQDGSDELQQTVYDGKVEYTSIAKWLLGVLGEEVSAAADEEAPAADEKPKKKASAPKPAAPVVPTELTPENFKTFCAHGGTKVNGQQPMCVILLGDKTAAFEEFHEKYGRDATLFFYTTSARALRVADDFQTALSPMATLEAGNIVVLRAGKGKTKFVVWRESDGQAFDWFMDLVVQGATTFEKSNSFPTLSK